MAATYVAKTIGGVSKQAIVVSGTGATEKIILQEQLTAADRVIMDAVSDETGADFAAKLAAHTMANGRLASVVYAKLIKETQAYDALVSKSKLGDKIDATLKDHEDRIAAVEP